MSNQDTKYDKPLPRAVEIWAVDVNGRELNYGQIHEIMHRDISVGNDYRKERIKHLTTLATGVFALTVTFHKDLFTNELTQVGFAFLLLGWALLVISLLSGIFHFRAWENFYLEHRAAVNGLWRYRTADNDQEKRAARIRFHKATEKIDALSKEYRIWDIAQSACLVAGLAFVGAYVGWGASISLNRAGQTSGSAPATTGASPSPTGP